MVSNILPIDIKELNATATTLKYSLLLDNDVSTVSNLNPSDNSRDRLALSEIDIEQATRHLLLHPANLWSNLLHLPHLLHLPVHLLHLSVHFHEGVAASLLVLSTSSLSCLLNVRSDSFGPQLPLILTIGLD